jgi:uncharacterized membrane protein
MAELARFFHLLGGFLLAAGMVVAGFAHAAARRRDSAQEVALLLGLARCGALLVGLGVVLVLAFGLWLVEIEERRLDEPWLLAALVLLVAAFAPGAVGGRRPLQARMLAARLAEEEQPPTAKLRELLDDRASLAANYLASLAIVAIVALMVWKPGGA